MGRLLLATLTACVLGGCIDWGSLYDEQPDGGGTGEDAAPDGNTPPGPSGCSDGTGEAQLEDGQLYACAGAWSVPGVVDETEPMCERKAGNDGVEPSGEGCTVSDLCTSGWHVCRDASDVALHGGDGACERIGPPSPDGTGPYIYLTRQRGTGEDAACAPDGSEDSADDAWGCGTLGLEAVDCRPLDRHLGLGDGGGCGEGFECGDDPAAEGRNITKHEPTQGGGVLCCSDDP